MNQRISSFLFFLFLLVSTSAICEVLVGVEAEKIIKDSRYVYLNGGSDIPSFIIYKDDGRPEFNTPEKWLNSALRLPAEFSLQPVTRDLDKLGMEHHRFIQTYRGIPLDGTMWLIHVSRNRVVSMNGFLVSQIKGSSQPVLNEQQALIKALQYVNADIYKWQMPEEEELLKRMTGNSLATYFPKAKLIYSFDSRKNVRKEFKLSFQFDIYSDVPLGRKLVSVNAFTGEITDSKDRIHEVNTVGTAVTGYSGIQNIVTDNVGLGVYRLRENGRGAGQGIETYNLQNGTSFGGAVDFTDDDNYWNNVNPNRDQYATDAHFAAEMTYDYFYSRYGRNSIDNAGMKLLSYVHYSSNYVNAFWDGLRMTYGDGNATYTPLTSLDIGGHEITHGLTEYTANLVYSYESGALNESFSDCFGTAVEWFADPAHAEWLIGEDIGSPFRSHASPNTYGDPDTYQGLYWYNGFNDNGGVHTNSGVQNYWFYLLSVGGSGTNDIGNTYTVSSIGIDKAAAIAFRTLTVYLTSTSQYADARIFSIQSAIDLYGSCSPEMFATIDAWYAVGLGSSSNIPTTISSSGSTTICSGDTVTLYATAPFGSTYTWYKNGSIITGETNAAVQVATTGSYYVITNTCGTFYTSNAISVNVIALSPSVIPSGNVTSCDSVILTAGNIAGYNVQWNNYGVPISGATLSTYTASLSGQYSFTLTASVSPPQSFSNTSALSIPDNSCTPPAISTIAVSGMPASIITEGISITVNITHPWVGDLHLMLEAPNGDILGLGMQAGSSGDNFINTVFSDNGNGPLSTGTAPFTGVFKPWPVLYNSCVNTTKTSFASIGNGNINPNGNWKFHVYDRGGLDLGAIDSWSITFPPITTPTPNCGPATSPPVHVSIGTNAVIDISPTPLTEFQLAPKNNFSGIARAFGTAVTIDGKGYYGFGDNGILSDWWEYNPATDSWTQVSTCPTGQRGGASFSIGSRVYIVCGNNAGALNTVYEWNSTTNTWSLKNPFPGGARSFLSACVINGKGYIAGGHSNSNSYNDIWEYNPVNDQWVFKTNIPGGFTGRTRMTSFSIGSAFYFGLGQTCNGTCATPSYSNDWFVYYPASNTVLQRNNFPGLARESGSGFAINNVGFIIYGKNGNSYGTDYWKYNVAQDTWTQAGNYSGSGYAGASAVVINNSAYLFGGIGSSGFTQEVLEFKWVSNICTNTPASLTLQASGGSSYLWSTGATTQSITGVPTGEYAVTVNQSGCSSQAYANIVVYPVPVATVTASGPLTFCSGNSVQLSASPANQYLWSNGPTSANITATTSGSYYVTVTGDGGCSQTSTPVTVVVYPGPPVTILGDSAPEFCQGGSVTINSYGYESIPFSPIIGSGTQVTLTDDQLSGSLPIGFNFTFFNNTYTNFYISSNGFITFGSTINGCCTGQIMPNPSAPNNLISFAWNDLYPPAGGFIEYFTTGAIPNRKLVVNFTNIQHWPAGNPVTAQVVLFETSNLIEIHTTSMASNGTIHTMGIENLNGTQAIPIPSRNGTNWTAANDGVRFGTGITSYLWNVGSSAASLTTALAGVYSVNVTDANNCTATSAPLNVTVYPLPNSAISADGPLSFCPGDSVHLTANPTGEYIWNTGDTVPTITVTSSGNFSVTVTDNNGCSETSAVTSVSVNPCSARVNLKVYFQGFYKGGGLMEAVANKSAFPGVCDSLILELHGTSFPYPVLYSVKSVIDINGNGVFDFPPNAMFNSYFFSVNHRNTIETWSANPVMLNTTTVNYDFTTAASQAFGGNLAALGGGNYGLFSGDVNQDKAINFTDLSINLSDAQQFQTGYVNSDLTGDWMVESADFSLIENNAHAAVVLMRP